MSSIPESSASSDLAWKTNKLGAFQDKALERLYLNQTWPHERHQLARYIILISSLQLLFAFAVVTEFGWDERFFAGFALRFVAFAAWMYPLRLTRRDTPHASFYPILYGTGMVQLLVLLWDGAFISIGELDYTANVLLETLITALLFYRSPRHLAFLLIGNMLAFLLIYRGIHSNLEYMRTAEFCAVLSIMGWYNSVYRTSLERRLFITNRTLRQNEAQSLLTAERRRLAQDMHDGLGGQLISALSSLKAGTLKSEETSNVLQNCIDDLRLVVDAISPAESDLLSALGNLRYRLEPRLNHAGVSLYWKLGTLPDSLALSPDRVLHVLRITQEALTNIIKHAQANTVVVSLDVLHNGEFCLEISDNGIGQELIVNAEGNYGKYGLLNMLNRAQSLRGQVTFTPNHSRGIMVRLVFPLA